MKKIIFLSLVLSLFSITACNTDDSPPLDNNMIDWNSSKEQIVMSDNIFVGKIIKIVDTYYHNENDTRISSIMPVTHFEVEVTYALKGIEDDSIIDFLLFAGYDENNQFIGSDFITELPTIGEHYLLFTSNIPESYAESDRRMIEGAVHNFGRPVNIVHLFNYDETADIKDLNADILELIRETELKIKEYSDIEKSDILFD